MASILENVLTRSPSNFLKAFFDTWPAPVILRMSMTCFRLHHVVESYIRSTWDPNQFFSRWFSRPVAFRQMLGRCNAIVSGSGALQFFDRTYYEDSDLDIFMRPAGVLRLSEWLRDDGYGYISEDEEYRFFNQVVCVVDYSDERDHPTFLPKNMKAVFTFSRPASSPSGVLFSRRVQLIIVDIDPVEFITLDFHTSKSLRLPC